MKTNVLSQIQRENKIKALAKETLYNSTAQSILCFLETKNVLLKLVLFIFLAFASGFTSLLVIKSILSYLSFEVFTTTITYFETPTEFPAVKICNRNQFTTEFAFQYLKDLNKNILQASDLFDEMTAKNLSYLKASCRIKTGLG